MKKRLIGLLIVTAVFFGIFQIADFSGFTKGDIDMDGQITVVDARIALSAATHLRELSDEEFLLADIDGSGDVSAEEARIIMMYALGGGIPEESINVCYGTRAVWVAIAAGDFPSLDNLSAAKLMAEIDTIVLNCKLYGLNTIFYQVRSHSDAMYESEIFPTSTVLVEDQGDELPLDTLEYFIEAAHEQGIELHAWINPYRVTSTTHSTASLAATNPAVLHPEWTVKVSDTSGKAAGIWYDPGLPEVRQLIVDGVVEILENYDVDGIHFDDYFYPYTNTVNFGDSATYARYGNGANIDDWRRYNVNILVSEVYKAVHTYRTDAVFGISPFGVWATIDTSNEFGIIGLGRPLESYKDIYADSRAWIVNGCVDYICPQLYWEMNNSNCPYKTLVDWWDDLCGEYGVDLYIGIAAYKGATAAAYSDPAEIHNQLAYLADKNSVKGFSIFSYKSIENDLANIQQTIKTVIDEASQTVVDNQLYRVTVDGSWLMLSLENTDSYGPTKYRIAAVGMTETVVGTITYEDVEYSLLSNGYYIESSAIEPVANRSFGQSAVSGLSLNYSDDYDTFEVSCPDKLSMTVGLTSTYAEIELFHVSNAAMQSAFEITGSSLFSSMTLEKNGDTVKIRLTYKAEKHIYGYYLTYKNNCAAISFKNPVKLSEGDKPLTGISVSVDPGHSTSSGATTTYNGILYKETDFNYAISAAVKEKLEALGAEVLMSYDIKNFGNYPLATLISNFRAAKPDMNISIHCNWVSRTSVNGTETWWCFPNSELLAEVLADTSTATDGLYNQGAKKGYYQVSRFYDFPSILFETLYMSNTSNMAYITKEGNIELIAQGIADGIVEYFRQQ